MSPSVAKLAANLDQAEALGLPYREAASAYRAVVRASVIAEYERLGNSPATKAYNYPHVQKCEAAWDEAHARFERMADDANCTTREIIDAAAAAELAEIRRDDATRKNREYFWHRRARINPDHTTLPPLVAPKE